MTLKLDQAPASIFAKQKSDALLVRHSLVYGRTQSIS
jgi:hypothetical protein